MEIKFYSKLNSTNQKAKELAKTGAKAWTIIVAETQKIGRGQQKKFWFSPKGGLYFSIILKPQKISDLEKITLNSAKCVANILKKKFRLNPEIKWPNDVLINNKKIAGILVENVIGKDIKVCICGIGLNTNIKKFPKELKKTATSIMIETKRQINNEQILNTILKELQKKLLNYEFKKRN